MVQVAGLGAAPRFFLSFFFLFSVLLFFPHTRINCLGWGFFLRSFLLVSFLIIVACRPRVSGIRYMYNKYKIMTLVREARLEHFLRWTTVDKLRRSTAGLIDYECVCGGGGVWRG